MRVYLQTLGCRLNEAEIESWSKDCRERGYVLAEDATQADLVVVNTCGVTGESVRKSRQLIRRAQRSNPHAKLVVSGCCASLPNEPLPGDLGIDLIVPNADKDRLIEIATTQLDLPVMPETATQPAANALLRRGRQRAFIKVQDGCRYQCSYCIVSQARGAERSRPINEVVREIRSLCDSGVQEAVLAGVHLGGYGSDTGHSLQHLIQAILADTDLPRLRIGSLEPWELPATFWSYFRNPRLMPHLHLPLQSGSDSVLRRMSRRCRRADFQALVERARDAVPGIHISTDIIVGFPGETHAEWQQTLRYAEQIEFGQIHIFSYSPRSGTKAAKLPMQLSGSIKRARARELLGVARQGRLRTLKQALNSEHAVLFESHDSRRGTWAGYTPNYLRMEVEAPADSDLTNRILHVTAAAVGPKGDRLLGELPLAQCTAETRHEHG